MHITFFFFLIKQNAYGRHINYTLSGIKKNPNRRNNNVYNNNNLKMRFKLTGFFFYYFNRIMWIYVNKQKMKNFMLRCIK